MTLTQRDRQLHWRTWNLLLQIKEATDGEDRRQRSGEMTERRLCLSDQPATRAFLSRGWVECTGSAEIDMRGDGDVYKMVPTYIVTKLGREALVAAEQRGVPLR